MDSILDSIKKMLGLDEEYEAFDTDIIILINSALMSLNQLGLPSGIRIDDSLTTWDEITGDRATLEAVKEYVYLKVRIVFDPPTSSYVLDSLKEEIRECEWRIMTQVFLLEQKDEEYVGE